MSDGSWRVLPYTAADKEIVLEGPSDGFYPLRIFLDFDDVNHSEVERRVPLIVDALSALRFDPPTEGDRPR